MSAFNKVKRISSLLGSTDAIKAVVSWPEFSITSFNMVSSLAKQGIVPTSVLDVGAHVGQFAVAAAKLFPNVQVHSFEPVPNCFEKLRRNVSGLGNVTVYPLALGASEGEVLFHINSHSQSSSALPLARAHRHAFPSERETQIIKAKVSTLDHVFADTILHTPVLLKLDVQGYEARTLRGGTRTLERVDYVVLETSFKPMYEGEVLFMDIVRMMEQQGLRFERPVGWLSAPRSGEILQMDALFVRAV